MSTATAPPGGHSVPLGLMSCVRESSPQDLVPQTELLDLDRNESSKKRRFHPFRGLRKMFRRGGGKVRNAGSEETVPAEGTVASPDDNSSSAKDPSHRSRSTSELLAGDEPTRRKSNSNPGMYPGGGSLSVSHDSVFTAEQHSTRGDSTSSDLDTAQSSSSLSIQQLMHQTGVRAELLDAVRRRGRGRGDTSEDDEDLGLPRSPCNSPTTTDKALKEHPTKSHSTCSDGSLLSMGSSEMDEDSFGQHSRHSSKLSLHDRRPSQTTDSDLDMGMQLITAPLSHSAARHKMAVRPKRTHGAPRRRRVQQLTTGPVLPTTPEVNEEISTRSLTPDGSANRETIAELYSSSSTSMSKVWNMSSSVVSETQLKSASLPPGLALPSGSNKLSRSRSNAGARGAKEAFTEEEENDEKCGKEEKKKEESFFGRFLARRSGKKKKKTEESEVITSSNVQTFSSKTEKIEVSSSYKHMEEKRTYSVDSGISKVARSGPASRQRIQPIDIPASPDAFRRQQTLDLEITSPNSPPENIFLEDAYPKKKQSSPETPIFIEAPKKKHSPTEPLFLDGSPPKKKHGFITKQTKITPSTSPDKPTISEDMPPIPTPRTILPHSPPKPVEASPRTILPLSISPPKVTWPEKAPKEVKAIRSEKAPKEIKATENKIEESMIKIKKEVTETTKMEDIKIKSKLISSSPPKATWPEPKEFKLSENVKLDESKTKVKITGLSSYQQRVLSYNDELDSLRSPDDISLDSMNSKVSITKSQSFRSKSIMSSSQDHSSLPFIFSDTSLESEAFTDSLMSYAAANSEQLVSVSVNETEKSAFNHVSGNKIMDNKVNIINNDVIPSLQMFDSIEQIKQGKTMDSIDSSNSVIITSDKVNYCEDKIENKADGITISCVNSQVQASVNTKSSNQVIVSISNPSERISISEDSKTVTESRESSSQVSVTKVQLKRESKPAVIEAAPPIATAAPLIPEFLKIHLNKVDKPTTNVVLTKSNSFNKVDEQPKTVLDIETDRDSGETITDSSKRKFSTDDVEIIDKDIAEEIVEVPSKNISPTVKVAPVKIENVKKLPTLIINNTNFSQSRKSSLISVSPTSIKPFLRKKSSSLELADSIKISDEKNKTLAHSADQLSSPKTEIKDKYSSDEGGPDVVMRKKSTGSQKRDSHSDEPELMKVFARRSLKLKDSEADTISQQVLVLVEASDLESSESSDSNKRDSDKENECMESPPEERKKSVNLSKEIPKPKEPLTESKYVETADVTLRKAVPAINNKLSAFGGSKFQQRTVSLTAPSNNDANDNNDSEKRRNKSYIDPKTDKKPTINNYRSHIMNIRDKDNMEIKKSVEIKSKTNNDEFNVSLKNNDFENEDFVPMFKRIQQRKEEWEQRAQQNMKK